MVLVSNVDEAVLKIAEQMVMCNNPIAKREFAAQIVELKMWTIKQTAKRFYLHRITEEDLENSAVVALMENLPDYDEDLSLFNGYVFKVIYYAMNECWRKNDFATSLNTYGRKKLKTCSDESSPALAISGNILIGNAASPNSLGAFLEFFDMVPADEPGPEETFIKKEEMEYLHSLLDKLSREDKSIIIDVFEGEMSTSDIARKYNLSMDALYKRKQRILKKLKNMWNY